MGVLAGFALVLLTLVGYSGGVALAGRRKAIAPTLVDLGVVIVLWAAALSTRNLLGRWPAFLVWVGVGLVMGGVLTALRRRWYPDSPASASSKAGTLLRRAWRRWKELVAAMGNFQSRIWLALFYFVLITPFAVLVRLFGDPLYLKPPSDASVWCEWGEVGAKLVDGKRQF
ncbi:MAG: hypothetical protein ACE5OS_00395 [Anaerolineae bacterium]